MPLLVSAVIYHDGNKLKKEQSGRINLTEPAEFRQVVRESLAEAVIYDDINRYRDEEIAVRGLMWPNNQDTKLTSKMEVFSEPETKIYP